MADEITRSGFVDNAWVERWDLAFAELYLDVLSADLEGEPVSARDRALLAANADGPSAGAVEPGEESPGRD